MMQRLVLCADSFSMRYPEVLGLEDERIADQRWLAVFCDGEEARERLADSTESSEVWVLGSDDVEAINLAAAIKADCREADRLKECAVYLVSDESGDVLRRARAARLDGVLSGAEFVCRYREEKAARVLPADARGGMIVVSPEDTPGKPGKPAAVVRQSTAVLLPVVSASGGVGKSTVAVLCALEAARRGQKTLLIDADFHKGVTAGATHLCKKFHGLADKVFSEVKIPITHHALVCNLRNDSGKDVKFRNNAAAC